MPMSNPIQAADVPCGSPDRDDALALIDTWRRACGWDGEGDPPFVVIGSGGRLHTIRVSRECGPLWGTPEIVPVSEGPPRWSGPGADGDMENPLP